MHTWYPHTSQECARSQTTETMFRNCTVAATYHTILYVAILTWVCLVFVSFFRQTCGWYLVGHCRCKTLYMSLCHLYSLRYGVVKVIVIGCYMRIQLMKPHLCTSLINIEGE